MPEESTNKKVDIRSETFKVTEKQTDEGEDEVVIEGVAVPYEVESRNGIIYSEESIKNAADSLVGKPFLFNHDPQQVLGKVVETNTTDTHLEFKAVADANKEKVKDIKNGYVPTVSIQAMVDESEEGEDNRVDVNEFLELSSAPIPGFTEAEAQTQAVRIEEFDIKEQKDWVVQDIDYDVAVRTNWDGVDKSEFPDEATWRKVHLVRHNDEYHLPIAHYEDDNIKLVYEALNSAYDMIETIEGIPAETVNEARSILERFREDEFPDAPSLDADESEENNDTMKEEDKNVSDEDESEVTEQDIEDLADALDWVDSNAPDEVTELIQDAIQSDEEEEPEEEPEEENTDDEEDSEDSDKSEQEEEKIDKLEKRINELETKLEEDEEVEESKQPGVGSTDKSTTVEDLANEISSIEE